MHALFVHDHIFYKTPDNVVYSPGGMPANVWQRYLNHFDDLTVVARGSIIDEVKKGLVQSSIAGVAFDLFYQIKGGADYLKYRDAIKNKLDALIDRADVVIIRVPSSIGSIAAKLCRKKNKTYVTEVVGCAWDSLWNYGLLLTKVVAPFSYFDMKKTVKDANGAIYVTQHFLQSRYPNKRITAYASNVQIQPTGNDILNAHVKLLDENQGVKRIGLIGNLAIKYKGFDTALEALKLVDKSKLKLYFVGGGDQQYVKSLIIRYGLEDCVEIVGRVSSGKGIFEFLDTLDLYIHPSKQEGLPRSVIEAMSRACPVLASSVAGIPELIDAKYLHKPGDSFALGNALNNVLFNKQELKEMAEVNFNKAREYGSDKLQKSRDNFFSEVKALL